MIFTLPEVLVRLRPGAKWKLIDINDYETLEWGDTSQTKPTMEECEEMFAQLEGECIIKNMRSYRDTLLNQTDKYIVADYPHATSEARQAWLDYRQALRDLPSTTEDPANPVWPVRPDEVVVPEEESSNVVVEEETSNVA